MPANRKQSDEENEARKVPEYYLQYLKANHTGSIADLEGITVDVFADVFPPATDARLLAAHLKDYIGNGSVRMLDMAAGCGVLSVLAASYGASGLAADISPAAVENMKHNFSESGADFAAVQSDVFANIPPQKFDLIIATPPHLDGGEINHPLDYAMYGASDFVDKFLSQADQYLAPSGKVMVTFAKWSPIHMFENTVKRYKWRSRVIDNMASLDGTRAYNLYELRR